MLDGVRDDEYAGQGSVWTAFDIGKSCLGQFEEENVHCNQVEPCSTPLPVQDGALIRSSGTQCKNA